MTKRVRLRRLEGNYSVCRLEVQSAVPDWAHGEGFVSISRSDDELSVVCRSERVSLGVTQDNGWSCYKLIGPFAFDETGIVSSVILPLSENGFGIFIVSTFDGDHLLLKSDSRIAAEETLLAAGHQLL